MKLTDILEGDVVDFPKKQPPQHYQSQSDQKGHSKTDFKSSPERDAILRLLKRLTKKTIGDWLWVFGPNSTPVDVRGKPQFALSDDYWKTFITHPNGTTETAEQQVEQRVKNLVKQIEKNGMNVANYNLEKMGWRDNDNPNKRTWEMKIYFNEQTPPVYVGD